MTTVFISSTSIDLADYRRAAIEECNRLGIIPVAMECFESMGVNAADGSRAKVRAADLYVGIIAHRYGHVDPQNDQSITELEFDEAGLLKLDRLCFLVDATYPWPPAAIDYTNHIRLRLFKEKIKSALICSEFTTVDDFRAKLTQSLVAWLTKKAKPAQSKAEDSFSLPIRIGATPSPPAILVGRAQQQADLLARLGISETRANKHLTIIRGWPGVGKTSLLAHIAARDDVVKAFPEGILWASLGEKPDVNSRLVEWARALGIDVSGQTPLEQIVNHLRSRLQGRRALLIVDDVWSADSAIPFKISVPGPVILIATRFRKVAAELAGEPSDVYLLRELDIDSGMELLSRLAPNVVAQFPQDSRQLVADLEGLPLALRVAGRLLHYESSLTANVTSLMKELRESSKLLESRAPDDRFDPVSGTTPTIQLLLQRSTDKLDLETKDRFSLLGVMAPKPATFDLASMAAIWQTELEGALDTARSLVDLGLLEPIVELGRFQLHAVLVIHARSMLY